MTDPFVKKTYYAMTLDPVHIGTGGYRLGRVDNTITREPGTNIPKIPGSSISGATRAYTAMCIQSSNPNIPTKMKYQRPGKKVLVKKEDGTEEEKIIYYSCAGKGADEGEGHCGEHDCEVCVPFGFSKNGNSFQGLAQFFDARILFFPVHSMIGPVWITSPSILNALTGADTFAVDNEKFKAINNNEQPNKLNFGWLMLEQGTPSEINVDFSAFPDAGQFCNICNKIVNRAYLVSDTLFSRIVNDNLEVRTSVAINPATGAAEEGALYTYEAIPRAAIMWFDVVYSNPEYFRINGAKSISLSKPINYHNPLRSPEINNQIGFMAFNTERGFTYLETLGIGGMNTRGMGRVRVLNIGGCGYGNT